ncbi:MAG: thiamine-phosphate kinase [Candidatus Margulisiibacteriota bacterium]
MKISELGEFGLIERIAHRENKRKDTLLGIGDDAAVLQGPKNYQLITTDTLVEDVHFKRGNFFELGWKALAVNISDIAAMGGWPTHALITLGLPRSMEVAAVDELYRGINALARKYKIDIVGGDTVASPKAIVISITLLGEVEKDCLLTRAGAKVGDLILVTGTFGEPARRKFDIRKSKIENRTREARIIAKSHCATAMIDSSDGLVRSVLEICRSSRVGAQIREENVPVAKGATLDQALYGGEEYELVFTVPKNKLDRLKVKAKVVGEIVDAKKDRVKKMKSGGYEHFR